MRCCLRFKPRTFFEWVVFFAYDLLAFIGAKKVLLDFGKEEIISILFAARFGASVLISWQIILLWTGKKSKDPPDDLLFASISSFWMQLGLFLFFGQNFFRWSWGALTLIWMLGTVGVFFATFLGFLAGELDDDCCWHL